MKILKAGWLPMSMLVIATTVAQAGVIKAAKFIVLHPTKDAHAVIVKPVVGVVKVVKAVVY